MVVERWQRNVVWRRDVCANTVIYARFSINTTHLHVQSVRSMKRRGGRIIPASHHMLPVASTRREEWAGEFLDPSVIYARPFYTIRSSAPTTSTHPIAGIRQLAGEEVVVGAYLPF